MFSIRVFILFVILAGLAIYAFKDWFKSACALVLLTAILEVDDMPKKIMGIQGLNPWNMLFFVLVIAWLVRRRQDGVRWDMPRGIAALFLAYFAVAFVAFMRALLDFHSFPEDTKLSSWASFLSDELINPLKFMIPAVILYEGARTKQRILLALTCVLLVSLAYSLFVLKKIPLSVLFTDTGFLRYRYRINREIGLHANDLAMLLAGAFWGVVSYFFIWKDKRIRFMVAGSAAVMFLAMALCISRAGYISFAGVGIVLGVLRWRRMLAALPVLAVIVCIVMPSIPARLGMGIGVEDVSGGTTQNWTEISSGRVDNIWPPVLDQIYASPILGYGRRAILRTPARERIIELDDSCPNHPHNAYLELLFDAGIVGFIPVMALYGALVWTAIKVLATRGDPLFRAVGGTALAMLTTLMITALASQSFFPTISMMSMWCACALAIRVSVMQANARKAWADQPAAACYRRTPMGRPARIGH